MSDYIERKSIRNLYSCLNPEDKVRVAQVLIDIDAIPSADAVSLEEFEQMRFLADKSMEMVGADRPQGEWIEQEDDYRHYWECSECGMGVGLDDIRNYCPNCGADMREREGE